MSSPPPSEPTTLTSVSANLDRVLALEEQTMSARSSVHEALVNLLQSRSELSTSGAMLSAATRAAMGKRGIAQLEGAKGLLDMAADTAAQVRGDAARLRDEVGAVLSARDDAMRQAAAAKEAQQETCARVESEGAAHVIATNELAARAQQGASAAVARAEAAELRAERAESGFKTADHARRIAEQALHEAVAAREQADTALSTVTAQLSREREVLAKVMSENVLFVKKLHFAESEREAALQEKEALRNSWRQQTEGWFATAAGDMQGRLLQDWGAADGLLTHTVTLAHAHALALALAVALALHPSPSPTPSPSPSRPALALALTLALNPHLAPSALSPHPSPSPRGGRWAAHGAHSLQEGARGGRAHACRAVGTSRRLGGCGARRIARPHRRP